MGWGGVRWDGMGWDEMSWVGWSGGGVRWGGMDWEGWGGMGVELYYSFNLTHEMFIETLREALPPTSRASLEKTNTATVKIR